MSKPVLEQASRAVVAAKVSITVAAESVLSCFRARHSGLLLAADQNRMQHPLEQIGCAQRLVFLALENPTRLARGDVLSKQLRHTGVQLDRAVGVRCLETIFLSSKRGVGSSVALTSGSGQFEFSGASIQ
jgi:hypothetical protein